MARAASARWSQGATLTFAVLISAAACTATRTPVPTVDVQSGTAQAVIGPLGGTLSAPDNQITLTVPPAAVSSDVTFTVGPTASPLPGAVGTVYELGPQGTQFATPATVTIRYANAELGDASASDLLVATVISGAWQGLAARQVDLDASAVSGQTSHLSPYALHHAIVPPAPGTDASVDAAPSPEASGSADGSADATRDVNDAGPENVDAALDADASGTSCAYDSAPTGTCAAPAHPSCSPFPATVASQCVNNPGGGGYTVLCCPPGDAGGPD